MDVSKHRPKAVLEYITVLRSIFIHIVHFVPAVNKSCAIWALGLLHLVCIFHFGSNTFHTQVWQRRLKNLGINPASYTFDFFQCTAVTYLKMHFNLPNTISCLYKQAGRFYIGSTSIGMAKREFNRMAKYRLATAGNPVHVELAVKYWSRRSDFVEFTAIPIASFSTYQEAWTFEHLTHFKMATTVEPSIHYQDLDAESIRMVGSIQETFTDFSVYSGGSQTVSTTPPTIKHQRCSSLHSLQTSSSLEYSFRTYKPRPPVF